jgi:hypothetical protein
MLWWKEGAIPALSCKQAVISDPQNALVEEGCAIPRCHASSLLLIHRMLWCKEGGAIPARCMPAAAVIHRMLVEEGAIPALPCKLLLL